MPALIEQQRGKLLSRAERGRARAPGRRRRAGRGRHGAARPACRRCARRRAAVAEAREGRARTEARLEGARTRRQEEARQIRETLGVAPEECLRSPRSKPGAALPPLADVERKLQRLKADRERLGGVNLQADDELDDARARRSPAWMPSAPTWSRRSPSCAAPSASSTARRKKRLDDAFETVDGALPRLFTTLFGGGEARLEMIEGEDPLEGGLEIIAKPPGKKPATLSLLSGGEQTLTALSLIFAVFLTNPSPICVLDEVDAPLDDANVDRFCTLMEAMAEETATRFLVITHHPMTMARMNRLFGVTMAEKGISQLVSVDLETAQRFREAV